MDRSARAKVASTCSSSRSVFTLLHRARSPSNPVTPITFEPCTLPPEITSPPAVALVGSAWQKGASIGLMPTPSTDSPSEDPIVLDSNALYRKALRGYAALLGRAL